MANVTHINQNLFPIGVNPSFIQRIEKYFVDRGLSIARLTERYGAAVLTEVELMKRCKVKNALNFGGVGVWLPHYDVNGRFYPSGHAILFQAGGRIAKFSSAGRNGISFTPYEGGWAAIPQDLPITICESVIKAIVFYEATGWPTIGLNGVAGWSVGSGTLHEGLMNPDLYGGRPVCVFYDSLSTVNPKSRTNVEAQKAKVEDLMATWNGSHIWKCALPEVPASVERPKGQWGVDDFVVSQGVEALRALVSAGEMIPNDQANATERQLAELNSQYAILRRPTRVVELCDPRNLWSFGDFRNLYKKHIVRRARPTTRGVRPESVCIADVWYESTGRHDVNKLVWRPGDERLVDGSLNLWGGFGVEPAEGAGRAKEYWHDVAVEALGKRDGAIFVNLLAALVQRPEKKIGWYVYLYGRPGTGKNYLMSPMERIFGNLHCMTCSVEQYIDKFNSMFSAARLVFISEMPESLDPKSAHRFEAELKLEADTNPQNRIVESKGVDRTVVERNALMVMVGNYHPAWRVSRSDRRGLFLEMNEDMRPVARDGKKDERWWGDRWEWMMEAGAAEVMRFLLDWKIQEGLLPTVVPSTAYRDRLIGAQGSGDFDSVLEELRSRSIPGLEEVKHLTAEYLVLLVSKGGSADQMSRLINSAGRKIQLALGPSQRMRVPGRNQMRLFTLNGRFLVEEVKKSIEIWEKYLKETVE